MVPKVTFQKGAETANFQLRGGRVRLNTVLERFNTAIVEYEETPGSYTVMEADDDGWSLETFLPETVVTIRCKPKSSPWGSVSLEGTPLGDIVFYAQKLSAAPKAIATWLIPAYPDWNKKSN